MKRILVVAMLAIVASPLAFGHLRQAADSKAMRDDAAVEKVVAAFMETANKKDWRANAELVHPDSLQDFKDMWLPQLQAAAKEGPDKQADLLSIFGKAFDPESVIALEPKEFFVSAMEGLAYKDPILQESSADVDSKIIGTVREGDDRAYVLVRVGVKNQLADFIEVMALKRSGTEWRMLFPDAVRMTAEYVKQSPVKPIK